MKRLKLNRKRSRDQIRYRLHTSIQAAAYLADDPSDDEINRELDKIMKRARPKAPTRPKPQLPPTHESATIPALLAGIATVWAVAGITVLFIVLLPWWTPMVAVATVAVPTAVLLTRMLVTQRVQKEVTVVVRKQVTVRLAWGNHLMQRGTGPDEADQVTGSQQEQPSLSC